MSSVFNSVSKATLDRVKALNENKINTFLMPSKFISVEAGQTGYLLNEWFNKNRPLSERLRYKSFFSNSSMEALHGAIKIARHKCLEVSNRENKKKILVYSSHAESLRNIFDPLQRGTEKALIPAVEIFSDQNLLLYRLIEDAYCIAAVVVNSESVGLAANIDIIFDTARERNILCILDESENDWRKISLIHHIRQLPDVVISGEKLTGQELAFAVFSMTDETYQPWNTYFTCMLHSSTYSGNRLSLGIARDYLLELFRDYPDILQSAHAIATSRKATLQAFSAYVNPKLVALYSLAGLDVDVLKAHGSVLTIALDGDKQKSKDILDFVSGGGLAVRGHTPTDMVGDVLEQHDTQVNYWSGLQQELESLTGLKHVFPAVSGASAVEIALSLGMCANKEKTRIITFKKNYAGKTLLALAATDPEDMQSVQRFGPLYFDVMYLDPLAPDCACTLSSELQSGKVALVWLELIQGMTGLAIPPDLVAIINENKKEGGYLIGVDEVLMGFYRAGDLFTWQGKIEHPDLITLSKVLSDATVPVAVTLVNDHVYLEACKTNQALVTCFETLYLNQFAAHVAYHVVKKIVQLKPGDNVKQVSSYILAELRNMAEQSTLIDEVIGRGFDFYMKYNYQAFPLRILGKQGAGLYNLFLCSLCLKEADLFIYFDRYLPAITLTQIEAELFVLNMRKIFLQKPWKLHAKFYRYLLGLVFTMR